MGERAEHPRRRSTRGDRVGRDTPTRIGPFPRVHVQSDCAATASRAACSRVAASVAMSLRPGSPVTSTSTAGFIASTTTVFSVVRSRRITTLQGSSNPIGKSHDLVSFSSARQTE